MQKLRLFIAIDINKEGLDQIQNFRDDLMHLPAEVRWTKRDTWHVTIKFLGETDARLLPDIKKICVKTGVAYSPSELEIFGVSAFPNSETPRVLFVNLRDSETLKKLSEEIDAEMETLGFKKEARDFHPHITIGRIKDIRKFLNGSKDFMTFFVSEGTRLRHVFDLSEFHLYESRLSSAGPVYTRLGSFKLGNL